MYALSLWPPWSSLVISRQKRIETRGWHTKHRGPVAIHATATPHHDLDENRYFAEAMVASGFPNYAGANAEQRRAIVSDLLPTGAILGIVDLVDCLDMDEVVDKGENKDLELYLWSKGKRTLHSLTQKEHAFGIYNEGRYAWILGEVLALPAPIPCAGNRRLWQPEPAIDAQLQAFLAANPFPTPASPVKPNPVRQMTIDDFTICAEFDHA